VNELGELRVTRKVIEERIDLREGNFDRFPTKCLTKRFPFLTDERDRLSF
jgi:hypothetical protein